MKGLRARLPGLKNVIVVGEAPAGEPGVTAWAEVMAGASPEYTIGANGPATMPAQLPPASAYTYAFEATAAEGDVKLAGKDVLFDRPAPFYVDNFLNVPVGTIVPVG